MKSLKFIVNLSLIAFEIMRLLVQTLFEVMQIRKRNTITEKNNVQKYYCDDDFEKANYYILIHKQRFDC